MCVCGEPHLARALDQKQAVLADGVQRVEDLGVKLGQRAPALAGSPRAAGAGSAFRAAGCTHSHARNARSKC